MEYSENDAKTDESSKLNNADAKTAKRKSITKSLCESTAAISTLLGRIIRVAEKVDPDVFNLFREQKPKLLLDKSKPKPAKPKPFFKRLGKGIKKCFTAPANLLYWTVIGRLFNYKLKKCGCYVPFSTAKSLVDSYYRTSKKKCKFARFWDYVRFWNIITIATGIVGEYLKENDLSLAAGRRTYRLCRRFIKAITSGGHPERTFEQLIDFATAKRRDTKWGYFNECEGGIFTEQVEEIIIVFLQFGPECSKTIFGSFRQLTEKVDPDVKRVARRIRDQFLEKTRLKSIADVASHTMITLLNVYCSKMRKYAKKYRNTETAADWTYAKQALIHLTSLKPIPENDKAIEKLVHDFTGRANRAGAETYNDHIIDGEDNKYEVSVTTAARLLHVCRKTIERWEKPNGENRCPVPGYDKKLRLKEEAFMGWVPKYTTWKMMNKKARKGKSRR